MDPIEFWSNRTPSARPQSFPSRCFVRREGSHDGEDPLSAISTPRDALPSSVPLKARIAVLLKGSPSRSQSNSWSRGTSHGETPEPVTSDVSSSRVKKETPVPLPVPVRSVRQPSSNDAIKSSLTRGRPKGWKPGMSYTSMRDSETVKPVFKAKQTTGAAERSTRPTKPIPTPSGYKKRRGRPPKASSPSPWQVYQRLNTQFVAFLCEWSGCKAELHNLDTLRRHVYAVHSNNGPTVCLWGKCGQRSSPDALSNASAFRKHVEEQHLVPMSWHVGDGPQNSLRNSSLPDDEIPDYLKDAQGNLVTPSIRDQELEDIVTWKNNRRKLKELLIRMNDNLPSEESDSSESQE